MLFMVVERFKNRDAKAAYRHFRDKGRGTPEGLRYVDSWIEASFDRCFQLMECDDLRLIERWALHWRGLGGRFEIVPVVSGAQTAEIVAPFLDS